MFRVGRDLGHLAVLDGEERAAQSGAFPAGARDDFGCGQIRGPDVHRDILVQPSGSCEGPPVVASLAAPANPQRMLKLTMLAEEPVCCEPVSAARFPANGEKIQGMALPADSTSVLCPSTRYVAPYADANNC